MKIFFYSKINDRLWGGGNQFLKMLKNQFVHHGYYENNPEKADVLLFNSYQDSLALIKSFFIYRRKKIIYRLGPILSLHRRGFKWKFVDFFVVQVANIFADLVIFQSDWSYRKSLKFGFHNKNFVVITNTVDTSIFYKKQFINKENNDPINLIYTSWSSNENKGFKYLDFLDKNLDFNKFKMVFIGNSPLAFENIKIIQPLSSKELSEKLRMSDIYISPTKYDACSNALLEGLSSGLPAVALRSGGNQEIVKNGGELFENEHELISQINKVSNNLVSYYENIYIKSPEEVYQEYMDAILKIK